MNSVPMAFIRDARPPQGARPDRRRDRARHADRVARRRRLRSLGRLRARQPRGLRARTALQGRRPGTRGRDRGVQRAHTDLPAPGRRLPDPVHADEGGPRHRHARPPPRYDPRADRPHDRRAPMSPARRSRSTSRSSTPEAADVRGNVRVDPKLVWMDSELVKAARDDDRRRSSASSPRRASAPSRTARPTRASRSTTVVEAPWGAYPTSCFPRYSLRRRLLPRLRRRAHRPRRRSGLLGRADRRPRDARRVPGRERRRRARCSRSPGGRRERAPTRSTS